MPYAPPTYDGLPARRKEHNTPMPNTNTKPEQTLSETIAVRISAEDCRALAAVARAAERTISWLIRHQLREFLRNQNRAA